MSGVAGGGKTVNDADIATFNPVERRQPLLKGPDARLTFRIVLCDHLDEPNPSHTIDLLRLRRERPRSGRAAEERDELAPSLSSAAATWPSIFQARIACKARPVFCQPAVGICSLWRVGQ